MHIEVGVVDDDVENVDDEHDDRLHLLPVATRFARRRGKRGGRRGECGCHSRHDEDNNNDDDDDDDDDDDE